jgi:polyphosphate kinase 2 (PPK2 family)
LQRVFVSVTQSVVAVDLTQFERGAPFPGDYGAALAELQQRLARLQIAQVVHGKRAIVIFEGWSGAGKKAALKRLVAAWDPCHIATRCVGAKADHEDGRHWLAPFWSALPPAGDTTIFYHSWYRRLIDDRAEGLDARRWARACDEINEFESQQRDHGTLIVKLFFHVSAEEQHERLNARQADEWRRHLPENGPPPSPAERALTTDALHDLFAQTDTRWAPWRIIDANDKQAARIAALTILADAFEKAIPVEPPSNGDTVIAFPNQKSA